MPTLPSCASAISSQQPACARPPVQKFQPGCRWGKRRITGRYRFSVGLSTPYPFPRLFHAESWQENIPFVTHVLKDEGSAQPNLSATPSKYQTGSTAALLTAASTPGDAPFFSAPIFQRQTVDNGLPIDLDAPLLHRLVQLAQLHMGHPPSSPRCSDARPTLDLRFRWGQDGPWV